MLSQKKLEELKILMTIKPLERIRLTERIAKPYQFKGHPFPQEYRGANFFKVFLDTNRLSKLAHRNLKQRKLAA